MVDVDLHRAFPGIPAKALDFFGFGNLPSRTPEQGQNLVARTVHEFATHLAPPPDENGKTEQPSYHHLNQVLQKMVDLNLLNLISHGGALSWDARYLCVLQDEQKAAFLNHLDFLVYGFPVVYEELRSSIVAIVHTANGVRQIGTGFFTGPRTIVTARHCLAGATELAVAGISAEALGGASHFLSRNEALDLGAIRFVEPPIPGVRPIIFDDGNILDEVLVLGFPNVPAFDLVMAAEKAAISGRYMGSRGTIASAAEQIFARTPLFLITARVRGGFSGGPVLNARGLAVGVVTHEPLSQPKAIESAALITEYDNLGYGVAVPADEALGFLRACERDDRSLCERLDGASITFRDWKEG